MSALQFTYKKLIKALTKRFCWRFLSFATFHCDKSLTEEPQMESLLVKHSIINICVINIHNILVYLSFIICPFQKFQKMEFVNM